MTKAVFLTLGRSQRYDFAIGTPLAALIVKWSASNIDFCNYLFVTAKLITKAISKLLWSINGTKRKFNLNLWLKWKFSVIKLSGWSLSPRLKKSGLGDQSFNALVAWIFHLAHLASQNVNKDCVILLPKVTKNWDERNNYYNMS